MDPFNLLETYPNVHGKRNKESRGGGSSGPQKKKKKKKFVVFLDKDNMPLSEHQKAMLLKDTFGVVQHSSKASDTMSGKLPEASTLITSNSMISERILPIQPPPTSQPIPVISKTPEASTHIIYEPILLLPPSKSPTIKPATETPQVSETLLQQQQQISSPSSHSQLQISPTTPSFVYDPQPTNPNFTTSRTPPSRVSDVHVSEGTPKGIFNYEPKSVISNPKSPLITTPSVFGPDFDESKIDLTVSYPKPPKPSSNIGKIMRKFESESRSRLHEAMTISCSSANPAKSDFAGETYKRWINSKIFRLNNFGYKVSERNFLLGLFP